MQNTWLWIVGIVVVLVGGFIWWQSSQSATTSVDLQPTADETVNTVPSTQTDTSSTDTTTNPAGGTDTTGGAAMTATVTYTDSGFSPATVTVKKGGTVKFVDERNGTMWVGSAQHPGHAGYDGTSRTAHCAPGYSGPAPFDQCAPGTSYSFTFDKVGTWPYHDHTDSSEFGKVEVVE